MRRWSRSFIVLLVACGLFTLLWIAPSAPAIDAQSASAQQATGARDALMRYYNAINLRNYRAAYSVLTNPTRTFDQYTVGFAATQRVEPFFGAEQRANNAVYVPSVLISYQTDETISAYYGCFTMVFNQGWLIQRANLRLIGSGFPNDATILGYTAQNCATEQHTVVTPGFRDLTASAEAHRLLLTYYDSINFRDYLGAYARWLQPLPGPQPNGAPTVDYRPPYATFSSGYRDTAFVNVYLGDFVFTGGSAGRAYLQGTQPLVVIGGSSTGTFEAYSGCYVIGRFLASQQLGIVSGRFVRLTSGVPDPASILAGTRTDCSRLNLNY